MNEQIGNDTNVLEMIWMHWGWYTNKAIRIEAKVEG